VTLSYGWFHAAHRTAAGKTMVLTKNGNVVGYSSCMGFKQWQDAGAPSSHSLFVLSNGRDSTKLGKELMKKLLLTG
jgi:hypothetical protein